MDSSAGTCSWAAADFEACAITQTIAPAAAHDHRLLGSPGSSSCFDSGWCGRFKDPHRCWFGKFVLHRRDPLRLLFLACINICPGILLQRTGVLSLFLVRMAAILCPIPIAPCPSSFRGGYAIHFLDLHPFSRLITHSTN